MPSSERITLQDFTLARREVEGLESLASLKAWDSGSLIGARKDMRHAEIVLGLDTGAVHGPTRDDLPPVIAMRFWCPSCGAEGGEPCKLGEKFTQEWTHVTRHRVAQRSMWRSLMRDLPISTGWTIGR